jgi:hypothetical protein
MQSKPEERQDLSCTVSVQELQARLTALLFPVDGNLAQTVPLTSHGKVVMALVPWYHFQGPVRMDAQRADFPIITETISSTEVRYRSYKLHEQIRQLAQAHGEVLVALVIMRHREPVAALMLWDHYELIYSNAASVLLSGKKAGILLGQVSTLTIVQTRNRLLRLPEDFAAGVVGASLVITKRVREGQAMVDRPVLLIIPYPEIE